MNKFGELNRAVANGYREFEVRSFDGWRLLLIGGYHLSWHHDVEVVFTNVVHINCPTEIDEPEFPNADG